VADFDLPALFKQAQALQDKFKQMQEAAAAKTVETDAGGGMVRVVVDGSLQIRKLEIEPVLLSDKPMLQDLIVVAVNDGLRRAQEMVAQEVGKLSPFGGLKIPGFPGSGE
jgi:DNA-binding YbaB/EbfC family protein